MKLSPHLENLAEIYAAHFGVSIEEARVKIQESRDRLKGKKS